MVGASWVIWSTDEILLDNTPGSAYRSVDLLLALTHQSTDWWHFGSYPGRPKLRVVREQMKTSL
jgi:hypothetical protein